MKIKIFILQHKVSKARDLRILERHLKINNNQIYMDNSVLVVVHPGYAINVGGIISDKFGNYKEYLSRLEEAVNSQNSIVLLYGKGFRMPFPLPNSVSHVSDMEHLVSRLKNRKAERIKVCGEYLYWYVAENAGAKLQEYSEKLSPEKRIRFDKLLERTSELEAVKFAKKLGLDPQEFQREVFLGIKNKVVKGCVRDVYDELHDGFSDVIISRELCYPINDPK